MATNVIHGTGKPIISISTPSIHTNTILALTGSNLIVELDTDVDLAALNALHGLTNYILYSYTSADVLTWGRIVSYSETGGDFITVNAWQNGTPALTKAVNIQNVWLELPYCQRLTEMWIPDFVVHKLYNGNINRRKRGFYYSANLDYSGYAHKNTIVLFKQLLRIDRSEIYFYPRADNLAIVYKVDLSPESEIVLNQIQQHAGHRSFAINLIGVERLPEIPIDDSAASSGYGDDYGMSYGTGL